MKTAIKICVGAGLLIWLMGCSAGGAQTDKIALAPTPTPLPATSTRAAPAACPDAMARIKAFYDSNDALQFDASLAFLADDATLDSWSEGVNGHHMSEKHLAGKEQIRAALGNPGLHRTWGQPDAPIYHESEVQVSGNTVTLMLRPDRLRPNGKPYFPYRVQITFNGCKFQSLVVIEQVTWL